MITHKNIGYSGRLGNQMFQYAALKSLALTKGFDYGLPDNLKIKPNALYDFTNQQWIDYRLELYDAFELPCQVIENLPETQYSEKSFAFDSSFFDINDNTTIKGYFQSYRYFDHYADVIKKDFTFKSDIFDKCSLTVKQYTNPVAVHIRRGDYVKNPNYWTVTIEYIQQALNHFTDQEYTFLIFSDDIEWCKQVFPDDAVFITNGNQFEDLCLMSLCHHNIISNSTYSWWGAYLNQNVNKKVIAPSNWFIPAKPLNDLYPNNWIVI